MSLRQIIEQEIRERGPIPFSRYMQLCLYHPELGYYSRHAEQFGKAGDFYTSSDVHAVFGRLLARQFEEMWRALGSPQQVSIVELGPGRGLFAQDVLDWSAKKFLEFAYALRYCLIENSPALHRELKSRFSQLIERRKVQVCYDVDEMQSYLDHTIVFANEYFDAFPVEVVSDAGQVFVDVRDGKFEEVCLPPTPAVQAYLDQYSVRPEPGERVEAPLAAQQAVAGLARLMRSGFVVLIDYGYSRAELLAGRHRGTVMAYRQHSASPNPYQAPGEQDITAHVNFTALAAVAEQEGLLPQPLLTQSQFLMGIGEPNQFADAFEDCRLPQEHAKVALQLKHLVTPAGMGESFHVFVASKGVSAEKVAALSWLSFSKSRL